METYISVQVFDRIQKYGLLCFCMKRLSPRIKILRLRKLRDDHGLTQEQLGALVKVSKGTIWGIESGRVQPNLRTAIAIAKVFGEPVEAVFSYNRSAS